MKKAVVSLVVGLFIMGCSNVHLSFERGVSGQKNIEKHFLFESVAMVTDETVDGDGRLIGSAFAINKDELVTARTCL